MNPFTQAGSFYRGNVHCHSTRSDGGRSPAEVVNDYRARGYEFLSVTDHFLPNASFRPGEPGFISVTDTRHLDTEGFITIPGAELHPLGMVNGERWHMVAIGLPLDFASHGDDESALDMFNRAKDAGAWLSLAHPHWNGVTEADALAVVHLIDAVEVLNYASEVVEHRGWGMYTGDILLNYGHMVQLNAADDNHFDHTAPLTFLGGFGGWMMVKAEALKSAAILAAMKRGAYYSSSGPEIHDVSITDGTVTVQCSNVEQIIVYSRGSWSKIARGTNIVQAELPVPPAHIADWLRVQVVAADGTTAWTNPIIITR